MRKGHISCCLGLIDQSSMTSERGLVRLPALQDLEICRWWGSALYPISPTMYAAITAALVLQIIYQSVTPMWWAVRPFAHCASGTWQCLDRTMAVMVAWHRRKLDVPVAAGVEGLLSLGQCLLCRSTLVCVSWQGQFPVGCRKSIGRWAPIMMSVSCRLSSRWASFSWVDFRSFHTFDLVGKLFQSCFACRRAVVFDICFATC